MTDKQPAQFDWATELSDVDAHVTLSAQEAKEIGARLRSMGEKLKTYEDLGDAADDMQLLRTGYAAARLEIESLKSQLAERASHGQAPAQAAPAAVAGPSEFLEKINTLIASINEAHHSKDPVWKQGCFDAADGVYEQIKDMLVAAPTTQPAPQKEAQEPAVDDPTRWLTVVYRDISPGDEARLLAEHPKASAMSWSHAIRDRDAARAVLAKWGTQPQAGAVPLIRKLVAALEGYRRNHNDTQPCDAEREGRAWLEGKPCA